MISVGLDKLNKMDYAGAIFAFKKALGGANDEAAYVYAQMGECYRNSNENRNATAMYARAVQAYRKLITDGRQIDKANEGIRLCENGIKLCSSE